MRCYNGYPDSDLQGLLDKEKEAGDKLEEMGIHPTYFPVEQKWLGFRGLTIVTEWCNSKSDMLIRMRVGHCDCKQCGLAGSNPAPSSSIAYHTTRRRRG